MMSLNESAAKASVLYFVIHMLNEVVCYFMLYRILEDPLFILTVALIYNCIAFVPQLFWGALRDLTVKFKPGILAVPLLLSGFLLFFISQDREVVFWISLVLLSTGNALIHISGAELTIRVSEGKLTPVSVFVSGGSFGVITGRVLAATGVSFWWIALLCLLMFPLVLIGESLYKDIPAESDKCGGFNYVKAGKSIASVVSGVFFIVAVRSYIGYGIPMTWKTTLVQSVLLFIFMGTGKALGGFLSDIIGIRKTAFISIIGALPFLILGNENMIVSLIGITFFSMTMSVTLGMIISVMKTSPGTAFGVTTAALFAGAVIAWFTGSDSIIVNVLIIVITSALCFLITLNILKPDKEAS